MSDLETMPLASLLFAAEKLISRLERFMAAEESVKTKTNSQGVSLQLSTAIFLPLTVVMLEELRRRGIENKWDFLIDIVQEEKENL